MHEFLSERAGQLQRLATTIRTGLDQAESAIPSINQQLAELARLGMSDFQIEGPTIYCRPSSSKAGASQACTAMSG